jgi:hypothetical protein
VGPAAAEGADVVVDVPVVVCGAPELGAECVTVDEAGADADRVVVEDAVDDPEVVHAARAMARSALVVTPSTRVTVARRGRSARFVML